MLEKLCGMFDTESQRVYEYLGGKIKKNKENVEVGGRLEVGLATVYSYCLHL